MIELYKPHITLEEVSNLLPEKGYGIRMKETEKIEIKNSVQNDISQAHGEKSQNRNTEHKWERDQALIKAQNLYSEAVKKASAYAIIFPNEDPIINTREILSKLYENATERKAIEDKSDAPEIIRETLGLHRGPLSYIGLITLSRFAQIDNEALAEFLEKENITQTLEQMCIDKAKQLGQHSTMTYFAANIFSNRVKSFMQAIYENPSEFQTKEWKSFIGYKNRIDLVLDTLPYIRLISEKFYRSLNVTDDELEYIRVRINQEKDIEKKLNYTAEFNILQADEVNIENWKITISPELEKHYSSIPMLKSYNND